MKKDKLSREELLGCLERVYRLIPDQAYTQIRKLITNFDELNKALGMVIEERDEALKELAELRESQPKKVGREWVEKWAGILSIEVRPSVPSYKQYLNEMLKEIDVGVEDK